MDAKTNGTWLAVVVDLILVSIVGFCLSSTCLFKRSNLVVGSLILPNIIYVVLDHPPQFGLNPTLL